MYRGGKSCLKKYRNGLLYSQTRSQEGTEVAARPHPVWRDFWKKSEDIAVSRLAMTGGHPQRGGAGDESVVSMGNVPAERAEMIRERESSRAECRRRARLERRPSSARARSVSLVKTSGLRSQEREDKTLFY